MDKDTALDLALEALEEGVDGQTSILMDKAITAIKQARSAPVWCGHCNGSGRMVRDPDIGTDQECFVCDGAGVPAAPVQEHQINQLEKFKNHVLANADAIGVVLDTPAAPTTGETK